jgi:hypothetical protein
MLVASAQSYSVIILVLLQLVNVQIVAGRKVIRKIDSVLVNVADACI